MARLMPWTSSVPRKAVDALIVWIAPKWIGLPGLIVTQPNWSFEQASVPVDVPGVFLLHAAPIRATAPTSAIAANHLRCLIAPPSWGSLQGVLSPGWPGEAGPRRGQSPR